MTRDCWEDFAASGRISDYLKYREQECRTGQQPVAAASIGVGHGADGCFDGHGAVSNASRGV